MFIAAEGLSRLAFPDHPQFWQIWSRQAAPNRISPSGGQTGEPVGWSAPRRCSSGAVSAWPGKSAALCQRSARVSAVVSTSRRMPTSGTRAWWRRSGWASGRLRLLRSALETARPDAPKSRPWISGAAVKQNTGGSGIRPLESLDEGGHGFRPGGSGSPRIRQRLFEMNLLESEKLFELPPHHAGCVGARSP